MKTRSPLAGLHRLWGQIAELEVEIDEIRARGDLEIRRLSRTKHRQRVLHELYWEYDEIPAVRLAAAFGLHVLELAENAGPLEHETNCLFCGGVFELSIPSRTALSELEGETGPSPKWRCCELCNEKRLAALRELRLKKGQRLTPKHRKAYWCYLQSPQWQAVRQKALKKAKNRCSLCNGKKRLNVHHRTYERIGQERASDVTVLCASCHERHHDAA